MEKKRNNRKIFSRRKLYLMISGGIYCCGMEREDIYPHQRMNVLPFSHSSHAHHKWAQSKPLQIGTERASVTQPAGVTIEIATGAGAGVRGN